MIKTKTLESGSLGVSAALSAGDIIYTANLESRVYALEHGGGIT